MSAERIAAYLDRRRAEGLVDIKFGLRRRGRATPAQALAELAKIFDAIDAGRVEPFAFNDRRA